MSNRVSEDQLNQALAKAGIMEYLISITFLECLAWWKFYPKFFDNYRSNDLQFFPTKYVEFFVM